MTTISVTEDVRDRLLKIASDLQIRLGRRVDLNEAITFLISQREKRPDLLEKACLPAGGFERAFKELISERRKDEERTKRRLRI